MAVNPDEIDRLLVDELNQLSVNDRERVMEEVHGVFDFNTVNGDHALEEALAQMQHELDLHYYSTDVHDCGTCATGGPTTVSDTERNIHFPFSTFKSSSIVLDAYREARSKNSSLLSDIYFLRGLLVAENFNPKHAAHRLVLYLQQMKELYGTPDVLFRPIFIDDLDLKAKEQLLMGSYQILPDRDSSGRRIFVYLRDICPTVSNVHRSQVFMYFAQKLVEDRDGMVAVCFLHNSTLFTGIEEKGIIYEQSRKLIECMPSRFHAIHMCMPNQPFYHLVKSAIMLVIGTVNRLHVRIHLGSHLECRYSLSTFGIPVNRLPMALDLNTTLRKDNITYHTKWLRMQRAKESAIEKIHFERCQVPAFSGDQKIGREDWNFERCQVPAFSGDQKIRREDWNRDHGIGIGDLTCNEAVAVAPASSGSSSQVIGMTAVNLFRSEFVECPRHEDCLFGRGRNVMKHPGNVAMRSMLEGKRDRYACAAHQKKSEIAWEVVNEIKTGGGRFLKELDTGLYTLVDDETARKKISIAFRDLKNKVGKRTQRIEQKQQEEPKIQQQENDQKANSKRTTKRRKFFHDCTDDSYVSSDSDNDCSRRCF